MIDFELPNRTPENDIGHVKRLWIYATAIVPNDWATDLTFGIAGHTAADEDSSGGTEIGSVGQADELIRELLDAPRPSVSRFTERTPLDFPIQRKCFIALKLFGDFWQFSRRSGGAVRTKRDLDRRYYRLRRHEIGGRVACISFCAQSPEDWWKFERHGINFYVDFLQRERAEILQLPVVIDPDIENKGGSGLLEPSP